MMSNPTEAHVVGWVTVKLHDDGGVSVEGNVGDARLAVQLLEAARAAVASKLPGGAARLVDGDGRPIEIPARDAPVTPDEARFPLIAIGDRPGGVA